MSQLRIYTESLPESCEILDDADSIAQKLQSIGIRFERWQANRPLKKESSQDEILEAYQDQVQEIKNLHGFQTVDTINMVPDHPQKEALRQKFLSEHRHSEDEVRYFIYGKGLFYIHQDNKVYGVLCEGNDFISVPANTKHWFDMGPDPDFKCIRFFSNQEGWVAQYTGDPIADRFPRMDELEKNVSC